jgi:hypothetical protein
MAASLSGEQGMMHGPTDHFPLSGRATLVREVCIRHYLFVLSKPAFVLFPTGPKRWAIGFE